MPEASSVLPIQVESRSETSPREYEAKNVVRHLAHELRQPLSTIETIACYFEMVLPRHESRARQQLERLSEVVEQAGWILSDSVHFLQASDPNPQLIDLDEFISESVADLARGSHFRIDVAMASTPSMVRLDPEQTRHLLQSLLHFFRQSSKADPRLGVKVSGAQGKVILEFEARGMEYTYHELHSMFEPYSSHSPAGYGLALASVRRIVQVHGGEIDWSMDGTQPTLVITFPSAAQA